MSVLIQCSKHMRTAYNLSRHRISNTLISNTNSHISQKTFPETNNGRISNHCISILPNRYVIRYLYRYSSTILTVYFLSRRSFFSTAIQQSSSAQKIDECIKKLDFDVRRMGRISKQEIEDILNEINTSSEYFFFF